MAKAKEALVVDDSKTMRDMVGMTLKQLDFEVTMAGDGVEAYDIAKDRIFDVVVTDINMPNMDGIELIRLLREESACKDIPILVLTTEGGEIAKETGKRVGATGWMVKPFRPDVLSRAVKKVCNIAD